jgi:hypothetical protein
MVLRLTVGPVIYVSKKTGFIRAPLRLLEISCIYARTPKSKADPMNRSIYDMKNLHSSI